MTHDALRECILCHAPTAGSTGAAGIRWPMICQSCKDHEDAALAQSCRLIAAAQTQDGAK